MLRLIPKVHTSLTKNMCYIQYIQKCYFCQDTGYVVEMEIPLHKICDGYVDCPGLQQDENKTECPARFACSTQDGRVSVKLAEKCDGRVDCLDSSDERDCPDRFQCSSNDGGWVSTWSSYYSEIKLSIVICSVCVHQ